MVRIICGVNGADFGRGRGPWTVQMSFRPEDDEDKKVDLGFAAASDVSISRYAEPDAEGVTPVFKTTQWLTSGQDVF